jgi:hypothetical protein
MPLENSTAFVSEVFLSGMDVSPPFMQAGFAWWKPALPF